MLANTPYQNTEIRRAFLFSLYAGLRYCDVVDLKYSNVDYANKIIRFDQNKTTGHSKQSVVIIPLSNTLLKLIGESLSRCSHLYATEPYRMPQGITNVGSPCRDRQAYHAALRPTQLCGQSTRRMSHGYQDRCILVGSQRPQPHRKIYPRRRCPERKGR